MRLHPRHRLAAAARLVESAAALMTGFAGPISCYTQRAGLDAPVTVASREVMPIDESTVRYGNLYEAIQHVRPEYLRMRPEGAVTTVPVAYLNGVQLADAGMLRLVPMSWVAEVKWVHPNTPSALYEFKSHLRGGIFVRTK
jgi:hypothetical protein